MATSTKKKKAVVIEPVTEPPVYRNRDIRQTLRQRRRELAWTYRDLARATIGDVANPNGVHESIVSKFFHGAINANVRTSIEPMMRAMDMFLYFRDMRSTDCVALLLYAAEQKGMPWSKVTRLSGYSNEWASRLKTGRAKDARIYVIQHLAQTLGVVAAY